MKTITKQEFKDKLRAASHTNKYNKIGVYWLCGETIMCFDDKSSLEDYDEIEAWEFEKGSKLREFFFGE